ncbi:MAG: hypothetical protein E7573_03985 [Ruminococcaceae bacterium]|nr:hypothetical protein [Oscillospiraceae bacterium]
MKKSLKTVFSFITVTVLVLSLASCSLIESMQSALNAEPPAILDTPSEDVVVAEFNKYIKNSLDSAVKITENISYSAGTPDVFKDGEEAGVLDAGANQLKNFIMSGNPGSEYFVLKDTDNTDPEAQKKDVTDSLLKDFDSALILGLDFSRNIVTENVTDENEKEVTEIVTNENGEKENVVLTTQFENDNTLHLTFNYFESILAEEAESLTDTSEETTEAVEETTEIAEETTETVEETTEAAAEETTVSEEETAEEETAEPETVIVYADDADIENVFGSLKNKEDVIKNFDNIKDYIKVLDYSVEYEACKVTADADISEETVSFINFEKNMKVTVKAEGVGSLASYGEIEIVFTLSKSVNYEFTYPVEEDVVNAEDTTAAASDNNETTEESAEDVADTTNEETAAGETTDVISTDEITEETSSEEVTAQ